MERVVGERLRTIHHCRPCVACSVSETRQARI